MSNDDLECEIDSLRDDVDNTMELALMLLVGRTVSMGPRTGRVTKVFPGALRPIEVTSSDGSVERIDLGRIYSVVPLGEEQ